MGNIRDWRDSFSQLELAKLRERDKAAEEAEASSGPPLRAEPVFPPDVAIPLPTGPAIVSIPLIPAMLTAADAEADLILPASKVLPKPRKPAKRKPAEKRSRKPAARKPAARKKPARKPAARKAKPKAASPRREAAAAANLAEALAVKLAETPAIPLPDLSTPLAETIAAPIEPLPRKASIAHYRKGGLIEAIGFWLRSTGRRFKAKLGASKALAKAVEPGGGEREIEELKAENERLRRQLDALLALSDAAQFKFQS